MLQIGRDHSRKGLEADTDLGWRDVLTQLETEFPEVPRAIFNRGMDQNFTPHQKQGTGVGMHISENTPCSLNTDGYFRLLEYEELQEARTSSRDAKRMSMWAIGISAVLAVGSIGLQLFVTSTVRLEPVEQAGTKADYYSYLRDRAIRSYTDR